MHVRQQPLKGEGQRPPPVLDVAISTVGSAQAVQVLVVHPAVVPAVQSFEPKDDGEFETEDATKGDQLHQSSSLSFACQGLPRRQPAPSPILRATML